MHPLPPVDGSSVELSHILRLCCLWVGRPFLLPSSPGRRLCPLCGEKERGRRPVAQETSLLMEPEEGKMHSTLLMPKKQMLDDIPEGEGDSRLVEVKDYEPIVQ